MAEIQEKAADALLHGDGELAVDDAAILNADEEAAVHRPADQPPALPEDQAVTKFHILIEEATKAPSQNTKKIYESNE